MRVLPPHEEIRREVRLLDNLQDDLTVIETSWQRKKISVQKAVSHLIEIVDSICAIARAESLEQFENICMDMQDKLCLIQTKKEKLEKRQWLLISELMELVKDALQDEHSAIVDMHTWENRQMKPASAPVEQSDQASFAAMNDRLPPQEGKEMDSSLQTDVKELLQQAQDALVSGNGETAKVLAMQAAELLARFEVEEARKREKSVRADLEMAVHEESEAEETLARINEEKADREAEVAQLNERLNEARSSFEEQQRACQKHKEDVEKIEAEITTLNEQRKDLLEKFQESLPARDAAERECTRLQKELERITPELDVILDSGSAAEAQMEKARKRREAFESDLDALLEKITP